MTKTLNQIFFFPPPKSEYFFQQHWKSEYFFRKKNNPPFEVKWSVPKQHTNKQFAEIRLVHNYISTKHIYSSDEYNIWKSPLGIYKNKNKKKQKNK